MTYAELSALRKAEFAAWYRGHYAPALVLYRGRQLELVDADESGALLHDASTDQFYDVPLAECQRIE